MVRLGKNRECKVSWKLSMAKSMWTDRLGRSCTAAPMPPVWRQRWVSCSSSATQPPCITAQSSNVDKVMDYSCCIAAVLLLKWKNAANLLVCLGVTNCTGTALNCSDSLLYKDIYLPCSKTLKLILLVVPVWPVSSGLGMDFISHERFLRADPEAEICDWFGLTFQCMSQ